MKTDIEEEEMRQLEDDIIKDKSKKRKSEKDRLITRESKIRPFRGIRKNAVNNKIKYVTGKVFSEDITEDLLKSSNEDKDNTPKQIHNNRREEDSTVDLPGFHTMISI